MNAPPALDSPAGDKAGGDTPPHGGRPRDVDLPALIDSAPWGARQKLLLALVGSAVLLDGFDNQSLGLAAPAIIREWGISKEALAPILGIGQFGMMIGTVLGGIIGDRAGRKSTLLGSVVVFATATLLMALVDSVEALGVLRLIAGCGLGGALPNAAALVAEYTPARRRSFAVTATIVCVPLGGVIGGLAAAAILPTLGWRPLFAVAGAIPLVLAVALAFALPESARFLLMKRGDGPVVRRMLARVGIGAPPEARLCEPDVAESQRGTVRDLLGARHRRDTVALWTAFAFCLLAIYAGFGWLPTMLAEAGYGLAVSSTGLMAFNLGGVVAALAGGWLIGRVGFKAPMIALAVAGASIAAVLCVGPSFASGSVAAVLVALALLGGCVNGVQTTLYALAAHIYPVGVRSTGVGAASSVGRIGAIASSVVGAVALTAFGAAGFYVVMIVAMVVTAAALAAIRGRTAA